MYTLQHTGAFKKDLKIIKKRSSKDFDIIRKFIVNDLQPKGALKIDKRYKAHKLSGNYSKHWKCHILNDLLLIWLQDEEAKLITLVRTGSHSDLF
jgi:mRNA interferase YafQ